MIQRQAELAELVKRKNHNMQYTSYVGAQLIGEEPRFELCRCTAFFANISTTVFFYRKLLWFFNSFSRESVSMQLFIPTVDYYH